MREKRRTHTEKMLFRDNKQSHDTLDRIFEYNGYAMYRYRSRSPFKKKLADLAPGKERIVFSLKGQISVNGEQLAEKDMAYVPQEQGIEIGSGDHDALIFLAETNAREKKYAPYVKRYRDAQRMQVGQPTFRRTVVVSIGEKDPANRFIAGYVEDSLGEWSSYPPHKHDDKPEAYLFYGIDPGFAIQLVLDGEDENAYVVHDYDTVLIPKGYHPHVNTSLTGSNYAWIISAPPDARNLGVDIHPAFKEVNLGRSHLTIQGNVK